MSGRHRGRVFALQVLFARDIDVSTNVEVAVDKWGHDFDLTVDKDARVYALTLIGAYIASQPAIDQLIVDASRNWRLDRMSRIDRNILRLGSTELRDFSEVPVRVVINEAVELAREFGSESSPSFVNGILDRIAQGLGRTPDKPGDKNVTTLDKSDDKPDA